MTTQNELWNLLKEAREENKALREKLEHGQQVDIARKLIIAHFAISVITCGLLAWGL